MELKNKLFFIVLLFLVLLTIGTTCFASFDIDVDGSLLSFPDLPSNVLDKEIYFLTKSTITNQYYLYTTTTNKVCADGGFGLSGTRWEYNVGGTEWINERTSSSFNYINPDLVLYSTVDLYDLDDNLVFQKAPQVVVEPMKIAQVGEIPQEVIKIVQMIIPACLLIFGTLLVVYLIKSKNLLQL